MDEKFRLVFACPEQTPSAEAYVGKDALVFDRFRDAVTTGCEMNVIWGVPFIAHRFTVFDPATLDLLYRELLQAPVESREALTPTSS